MNDQIDNQQTGWWNRKSFSMCAHGRGDAPGEQKDPEWADPFRGMRPNVNVFYRLKNLFQRTN
ncbi:MAG TPA: hypothetical protein VMI35_06630 [Puia sp.]|nr:hypothetical protein [Puia sp.]